jgi:hypothetical protein
LHASLSLLVSYLNSLIYIFVFVFAFLYLFMCCALFLIVHPILGNNMQVLGELPRKSKTMTRTWCILFLVLSPSCYSPSVSLHIFFVSVGSVIDGNLMGRHTQGAQHLIGFVSISCSIFSFFFYSVTNPLSRTSSFSGFLLI